MRLQDRVRRFGVHRPLSAAGRADEVAAERADEVAPEFAAKDSAAGLRSPAGVHSSAGVHSPAGVHSAGAGGLRGRLQGALLQEQQPLLQV